MFVHGRLIIELGNGIRGMTGMQGIRMEMWDQGKNAGNRGGNAGNQGGNVGNRVGMLRIEEIWGGNEENQGDNLRIVVEMMNKNCGEG